MLFTAPTFTFLGEPSKRKGHHKRFEAFVFSLSGPLEKMGRPNKRWATTAPPHSFSVPKSIPKREEHNMHPLQQLGFPLAQTVKNLPAMQETWVRSLGLEDPPSEGNGYPLQYSCLENSTDRGTWQAIQSMGWQSQTRLRD